LMVDVQLCRAGHEAIEATDPGADGCSGCENGLLLTNDKKYHMVPLRKLIGGEPEFQPNIKLKRTQTSWFKGPIPRQHHPMVRTVDGNSFRCTMAPSESAEREECNSKGGYKSEEFLESLSVHSTVTARIGSRKLAPTMEVSEKMKQCLKPGCDKNMTLGIGNRYKLVRAVDASSADGMGWIAEDTQEGGAKRFIKTFKPEIVPSRAHRELYMLKKLEELATPSKNVVTLVALEYTTLQIDGKPEMEFYYQVLEYCPRGDLHGFLINRKQNRYGFSESVSRNIWLQVLQGVHFLHLNHLYHRDIKWENILVEFAGANSVVFKLCDFGAGTNFQRSSSQDVGTKFWLDPAIMMGADYDAELSDVFQCGVLLFLLVYLKPVLDHEFGRCGLQPEQFLPLIWQGKQALAGHEQAAAHLHQITCPFTIGKDTGRSFLDVCLADLHKDPRCIPHHMKSCKNTEDWVKQYRIHSDLRPFWEFWGFSHGRCGAKYRNVVARMIDIASPHDRIRIEEAIMHPWSQEPKATDEEVARVMLAPK